MTKLNKWVAVNSDMDHTTSQRIIGQITRINQFKRLKRIAKSLTWYRNCGHQHDCCGCLFSQSAELTFNKGQAIIVLSQSFNY